MSQLGLRAVGNEAGWDLELFTGEYDRRPFLVLGSQGYHATIEASLPGGLQPGSYAMAVEGISAEDFDQVSAVWRSRVPLYARLYLCWRDTLPSAGLVSSLASLFAAGGAVAGASGGEAGAHKPDPRTLVAVLRVTRFSRRAGTRRYEAVIEGHERVYDNLLSRLEKPVRGETCLLAAASAAAALGVTVKPFPLAGSKDMPLIGAATWSSAEGDTGLQAVLRFVQRMEEMDRRFGRGMALIRDGQLYLGPGRPIPLAQPAWTLDESSGLVEVEITNAKNMDPQRVTQPGESQELPARDAYRLLLKGRPEIKPGDVVRVSPPGQASVPTSMLGAAMAGLQQSFGLTATASGREISIYVTGVMHRMSRTTGFVTTLSGVDLLGPGQEWDRPTATIRPHAHPADPPAAPQERVAGAIQALAQTCRHEPLTVGDVRASHVKSRADLPDLPAQTVSVRRGLAPSDGRPRQARRLRIDPKARAELGGVPYVTPFAWGKCGLVLPRYPGTRIVLGHHLGHEEDPIDLGALWESGRGPDAQAGDWWLILPAEVPPQQRQSLETGQEPQEPTGLASNDLIDADGKRVIEVGQLTVRIGRDLLQNAGTRPEHAEDDVTIQHQSGSRIVIKQNGDIVIQSEGELTLSAATRMTLEADDVVVKVTNAMDVGNR